MKHREGHWLPKLISWEKLGSECIAEQLDSEHMHRTPQHTASKITLC